MKRVSMKAVVGTLAVGALVGGCATSVEMGPGYYHYDTGLARPSTPPVVYQEPAVVYREPAVVYREPAVVYREPTVVYRDSAVVYREPTVVYRTARDVTPYHDHGQ
ncbi:MAG TPA: hypothetical protein VN326_12715 [Casimicrobiaceae bacterium]|jgi:hypothetical protein|nr:hypothetical protein [Casimicrobiaceae bacterium]